MVCKRLSGRACACALWFTLLLLSACGGGDGGDTGPTGPTGPVGPPGSGVQPPATVLNFLITDIMVNSPPVIEFTVTNEDNVAFPGIEDGDLRFNIAKLIPPSNGNPSRWQNYIVSASDGAMRGSQERFLGRSSDVWGELEDHGDGTYAYTFETDITTVAADCPAPCTEADGTPLDLSWQPGLKHRVSIQQGNSDLPLANVLCDFVPADVFTTCNEPDGREIVSTGNCNECHDKITAHGSRFEIGLCVTCHNPGTWTDSDTTVDMKVMIHKIHRGAGLPSVVGPDGELEDDPDTAVDETADNGSYAIDDHDFSDVHFPQDIRNCDKCHDSDPESDRHTPQGGNWMTAPSIEACGSCHDDVDFSTHSESGGPVVNADCLSCHKEGGEPGSIAEAHTVPGKAERAFFQYNILAICGTPVDEGPRCTNGEKVTVTFSVTDPDPAGARHEYDGESGNAYNIRTATSKDPEYATGSTARLNVLIAWDTRDYTNDGGSGSRPSRAASVNVLSSGLVTDHGNGTFTLASNESIPGDAIGSGAIAMEGRGAASNGSGSYSVSVPVNGAVEYFAITHDTPQPRRQVVDAITKCDRCHDVLSVHGGSRNNNGQLCVLCHNPSGTDIAQRPKDEDGLPDVTQTLDSKREESIDFKRLIHGIHAASAVNFDGTEAHGFRNRGLVVYGFGGEEHDFSHVRFPGVLSKCETCHLPDTYTLDDRSDDGGGNWELPAQNGIRGSTVHSYPTADPDSPYFDELSLADALKDQSEDLKYSPIASVCSACHDGTVTCAHMSQNGGLVSCDPPQGDGPGRQEVVEGNVEGCPECHGPGTLADVKLMHDEAFANFLGEFIP